MPGVLAPHVLKGKLKSRMITIVTDFRVHGFWVNPAQELYVGMCEATRRDLVNRGVSNDRIELWGIPVHPKFRKHLGRPLLMREFGLSEDRQTVLITSGSFGFASIPGLLECLEQLPGKIQLIFVAGANQKLYETLKNRTFRIPALILGYANNMDQLMEVSDVALVKPGGSTICELLVKACPFFMMKPIPGQEEGNGEVLVMAGISHYITSTKDLHEKWSLLADPQAAKRLRTAIAEFAKPEAGLRIAEFVRQEMSHGA
jgi:processive 1,2-diacylglycerol beta-glucosyltransferase